MQAILGFAGAHVAQLDAVTLGMAIGQFGQGLAFAAAGVEIPRQFAGRGMRQPGFYQRQCVWRGWEVPQLTLSL